MIQADFTTVVGTFTVSATFEALPGITVLSGPSGAGKSLTIATIAGLLRPTSGSIKIGGREVADATSAYHLPTQQRGIGMVFQSGVLLPHRSPLDNIAVTLKGPRPQRRALAAEWLERVNGRSLEQRATRTLSGGEQQRVALARALASNPSVLLLDEPFSALDRDNRIALRALVRELVDDAGITALLVTHDRDDVDALADRVVHYEPGRTTHTTNGVAGRV
jgi:ABC-type sulfate/molybdate transport systems ATPase subunit